MFTPGSNCLYDFYVSSGVAFYIPFYQRQYSWDREDANKLMDDLCDGVNKICVNKDYLRFLGTVILLDENEPAINEHYDSLGLITRIQNVIDGQQRLCTISIMAILISNKLIEIRNLITINGWDSIATVSNMVTTIDNKLLELEELFSTLVKKTGAKPNRKPKIIRAYNKNLSPIVDQWTLSGDQDKFYKSDVAKFISNYIYDNTITKDIENEKLLEVIDEINTWLSFEKLNNNLPDAQTLLLQNPNKENLAGFIEGDIDLSAIQSINAECFSEVCIAIKVLALMRFLTHKTYITWIECPNENLAFDMFQSLNATGTPLTAIEVFKPLVVNTLGPSYGTSSTKTYFEKIDAFFDVRNTAAEKEKLTNDVLIRFAMGYDGREIGKRFSEQRDYLTSNYTICNTTEKDEFVRWLCDISEYWNEVIIPRKPNRNSTNFSLANSFITLGLSVDQADLCTLIIFYIKDANHAMAHYLISLFYSRLIRAQGMPTKQNAVDEFFEVCKAVAGFFTLWRAAASGFPDDIYRNIFKQGVPNISIRSGQTNQLSTFVKSHFRDALVNKGVFDLTNKQSAKAKWLPRAIANLNYGKKTVCKFCLFVAAHDKSPDTTAGNEGLIVVGTPGCSPYLTCKKWFSEDYEVIEHIGNRDKPQPPHTYVAPDPALYPGDYSVVDKIGNLTLWSRSANSSTYPEWPDKAYYYSTLTSLSPTTSVNLAMLQTKLGIASVPPSLAGISASSNYMPNLAPIALRGENGLPWDKSIVDKRTECLCGLVFDFLYDWLI